MRKQTVVKPSQTKYLIGIDEVGRGPLAGPVAVGAFLIPLNRLALVKKIFHGVKESKQLTGEKREEWFRSVNRAKADGLVDYAVTFKSEKVIDNSGLAFAIRSALETSIKGLRYDSKAVLPRQCRVLLDGGLKAPVEYVDQKTIIKGDEKEMVIALASICAKVLRDRKMVRLADKYPHYSFDIHKGYGTRAHYTAIKRHGISAIHRKSFL